MPEPTPPPLATRVQALVFAIALVAFGAFYDREPGTNALAHYDQSVSIAVLHELTIDRVLRLESGGERYAETMDWSRPGDGHYYPAKAPGLSLAGAPLVWVLAGIDRLVGEDPLARGPFEANAQILAWWLVALPSAGLVVGLARLARRLGAEPTAAVAGALGVTVATIFGPFASVLYAHAPTGVALGFAASLVVAGPATRARAALAGALGGVAVLLTYQAALVLPLLMACLWWRTRDARPVVAFVVGGLPALAIHLVYHAAAFGSPLRLAYDFQNDLYGGTDGKTYLTTLVEPGQAPGRIIQLTVLPYRGLFFYSPFALFAVIGGVLDVKEKQTSVESRLAAGLGLATLAVFVVVHALHHGWWGGYSTGPRYLVPALPLLAPLAASAVRRWPRVAVAVGAASFVNAFAIAAVSVSVHERVASPLTDAVYPGLIHGQLGRDSFGSAIGLRGLASVFPMAATLVALGAALALTLRAAPTPNETKGSTL